MTLFLFTSSVMANQIVHHELNLNLNPATGLLKAEDKITLPKRVSSLEFELHSGLALQTEQHFTAQVVQRSNYSVPITTYRITFKSPQQSVTVRYNGKIAHGPDESSPNYADTGNWTPGIISKQGVFLGGSSVWYPQIASYPVSFSMHVNLPEDWHVVSQGLPVNGADNSWQELAPQEEIYLIAGRYHVYERPGSKVQAQVYLISPDEELAELYLAVTEQYIELYNRLIGEYPYGKFALVENFLQTGYGMPSFTLLGNRVIRLPFIPYTSYPHEILHNWWGNSVYVDYASGNWSEGLTSYLADHLLKEQRGEGANYRRDALQRYADYVSEQKDFPLSQFKGRHSRASQAIGYGKTLMFFHMLRQHMGDQNFTDGLRLFYQKYRFKIAGYQQLQSAFEQASGKDLSWMFKQWLVRTGLPGLEISSATVKQANNLYELQLELAQTQQDIAFELEIPVWIQTTNESKPIRKALHMTEKQQRFVFPLNDRPIRLAVDPLYDALRRLHASETPSSLGQLFGADQGLIVLPARERPEMTRAYQQLANKWSDNATGFRIIKDDEIEQLPDDQVVWLFGKQNRFATQLASQLDEQQFQATKDLISVNRSQYAIDQHSFAVTTHSNTHADGGRSRTLGWLVSQTPNSLPGLSRKLPHYSKYSYLIFEGDAPNNVLKGQWQLSNSTMWVTLPGADTIPVMKIPQAPALVEVKN